MSLFKQLGLAIVLMLTLIFVGSVLVSTISAKSYLEQQLTMKNADNAAALGTEVAEELLANGAKAILESLYAQQDS